MHTKLSSFAVASILSVIVLLLTLLVSADLHEPETAWLGALALILVIHIIGYVFDRYRGGASH